MPEETRGTSDGGAAGTPADRFERELTTDLSDRTNDRPRGLPLHTRILLGLAVGVVAGVTVNLAVGGDHPAVGWVIANVTEPLGQPLYQVVTRDKGTGEVVWARMPTPQEKKEHGLGDGVPVLVIGDKAYPADRFEFGRE